MTVPMKVGHETVLLLWTSKINDEDAAVRLQHSSDFASTLLARLSAQVVKHECGEDDVKLRVTKRQRLDNGVLEANVDACFCRFLTRARNHLFRGVDPVHRASRADYTLSGDRERPGSAPDIQNRLIWCEVGEVQHLLAKGALPAQRHKPDEGIVAGRPVQDAPGRVW